MKKNVVKGRERQPLSICRRPPISAGYKVGVSGLQGMGGKEAQETRAGVQVAPLGPVMTLYPASWCLSVPWVHSWPHSVSLARVST